MERGCAISWQATLPSLVFEPAATVNGRKRRRPPDKNTSLEAYQRRRERNDMRHGYTLSSCDESSLKAGCTLERSSQPFASGPGGGGAGALRLRKEFVRRMLVETQRTSRALSRVTAAKGSRDSGLPFFLESIVTGTATGKPKISN